MDTATATSSTRNAEEKLIRRAQELCRESGVPFPDVLLTPFYKPCLAWVVGKIPPRDWIAHIDKHRFDKQNNRADSIVEPYDDDFPVSKEPPKPAKHEDKTDSRHLVAKNLAELYEFDKNDGFVPKEAPKPSKRKGKNDRRPTRTKPTNEQIVEVEFTEQQSATLALWRHIKVSIWDTLTEINFDTAHDDRQILHVQRNAVAVRRCKTRTRLRMVERHASRARPRHCRNFGEGVCELQHRWWRTQNYLLEQRSINSYPFSRGVEFLKSSKEPGYPGEVPYNRFVLQFPFLGDVKLKPRDRHQRHFLRTKEFDVHSARIWRSPTTEKWYARIHYTQVNSYAARQAIFWEAYEKLWQPDIEFIPTKTVLAELANQGIALNERELAKYLKEINWEAPVLKKINGRPVRGYYRPNGNASDDSEQLELRYEALFGERTEVTDDG